MTLSVGVLAYLGFVSRQVDLSWLHRNFLPLMTASILFCFLTSGCLYAASFSKGRLLAAGGDTRIPVYDFFMGRELNPRLGSLDVKEFLELYPGLIGWLVLDLGMAAQQLQTLGHVQLPMVLVCAFHALYVADSMWHEESILTTMDITTDGLGFMLVFGDLAWVPFTYCLQARYLADHPQVLFAALALPALGHCGVCEVLSSSCAELLHEVALKLCCKA